MTSIKDFDVYEEKLITECTSEQLQNAISTKWVKRAKGDGVKCRVCVRGYDQEVDPDDTYASTPSLITLKLLLTLAVAHGWHILAGDVSTAFLHALLTDEVFVIPPVEYYIPTVEFFGNFAKPCMDLSSPLVCGSSTLQVLQHHLGLNV